MCLVGYIASRSPGFKALQNLIATTWHCEAFLTIHASGWLIFKFANDADKLNVLSEGALILFMVGLSSSGQCQNILISLSQKCALFQFGLSFPIFHSSAGPLNVCLRLPPIVPEQQQTPAHTPAPKERDSVFHQLGSQVDNPVVDRSKANLPADCVPTIK
jgi:hypothetical protein